MQAAVLPTSLRASRPVRIALAMATSLALSLAAAGAGTAADEQPVDGLTLSQATALARRRHPQIEAQQAQVGRPGRAAGRRRRIFFPR
jgi:hypothetical protein